MQHVNEKISLPSIVHLNAVRENEKNIDTPN